MSDKDIDPALAVEIAAMRHQNAMNSVIDRGDSPIQQFYNGSTVLVTGATGFLGKQLVEKLFRSCNIKKMFLLVRVKKGRNIQERLDYMLKNPAFDGLHAKQPGFVKKLIPIASNVAEIGLGLSKADRKTISEEVDVVFHLAATVRFDEPIQISTLINVRGTREIIGLARECTKLRIMVYVSTAYVVANDSNLGKELFEEIHPSPVPPELIIQLVETLDEEKLTEMTPTLIKGWPNTYAFTKAIAEELVKKASADLPVCLVRPPIVAASYYEPMPGWLDTSAVFGTSGIYVGIALGVLHAVHIPRGDTNLAIVPVDYVNNAIIAAGWNSATEPRGGAEVLVYTVANGRIGLSWNYMRNITETECSRFPSLKAVWYCFVVCPKTEFMYWILHWTLHLIPAYLLDGVCFIIRKKPKEIQSFVKLATQIEKMILLFSYYMKNDFLFQDNNIRSMIDKMSAADKHIYNCDIRTIDRREYVKVWGVGIKKYILKDDLTRSAEARRRQNLLHVLSYFVGLVYLYVFWCTVRTLWRTVEYVF